MLKTVRICGMDYEIIEFDGNVDEHLMGKEVYKENKIYINKDIPDAKKRETLLHEVLHIVFANAGLRDGDDEERIITALSCGLYQALVDNLGEVDDN